MGMNIVWLLLVVAFIIAEAITYQLVSIWFAIGGIAALVSSFVTDNALYQTIVFIAVSAAALLAMRPIAKTKLRATGLKTNTEKLIGKEIAITEDVDNILSTGQGKINGMVWTVRSSNGEKIKKGTAAVVERIEGVKLIVKEKEDCR